MSPTIATALTSAIEKFDNKVFIEDGDLSLTFRDTTTLPSGGSNTYWARFYPR